MVFRVQVVPISRAPINVSVSAEATPAGSTFLRLGPWTDIRDFLAQHRVGGVEFSDIETELHKNRPVLFEIDVPETELSLAQFNAVRKRIRSMFKK
jgi:hypothetical protein